MSARTYTKNVANYMSLGSGAIGSLLDGAGVVSVAARVYANSFDASTLNDTVLAILIDGATTDGIRLAVGNGAVTCSARSQAADSAQTVSGSGTVDADAWVDVGAVIDFAGDSIRVYLDGVEDGASAVTFGAATYTQATATGQDRIGADGTSGAPTQANQIDGLVAYAAAYIGDIGDDGFAQLALGLDPLLVQPQSLAFRMMLGRYASTDIDLIGGLTATITGSLPVAAGPRLYSPIGSFVMGGQPGPGFIPPDPTGFSAGLLLLGVG